MEINLTDHGDRIHWRVTDETDGEVAAGVETSDPANPDPGWLNAFSAAYQAHRRHTEQNPGSPG